MLRSSLIAAGSVILCTAAAAQSVSTDLHRVQSTIQNGGLYHVATGTWTRNVPTGVNLGPDVVYNNTANTRFTGRKSNPAKPGNRCANCCIDTLAS